MNNSKHSLASRLSIAAMALGLATAASSGFAATFASTTTPSAWTVAATTTGTDGDFASFLPASATAATAITARPGWIANNDLGTNGGIGTWTFFTFQQSFTLTASEAATYDLKFQWAADDSGEGFAARGTWTPKYALNGGPLVAGSWATGETYDFGNVTNVSGFQEGVNTLTFYVEGNGVTDGMALKTLSFTSAVPEPGSMGLLAAGMALLGVVARRAKRRA